MDDDGVLRASLTDPAAFTPLVTRHGPALHAYLARRAGTQTADDLLAQTWTEAFASRATYDAHRGGARGWLFGVARHTLLAYYRETARAPRGEPEDRGPGVDWDGVDARLDAAAVAPRLRRALADLPDVERELLLLVCWEDLGPAEAAAVLGIPVGTARSRLHRARRRLRAALGAGAPTTSSTTEPGGER